MCHVLIIEDNPLLASIVEAMLAEEGATSFAVAASETEAIAAARGQRPDLIASDIQLGHGGGTGTDAVRAIQAELGEMPVIFMTGAPEECGACPPPGTVLPKPFSGAQLAAAYRRATQG